MNLIRVKSVVTSAIVTMAIMVGSQPKAVAQVAGQKPAYEQETKQTLQQFYGSDEGARQVMNQAIQKTEVRIPQNQNRRPVQKFTEVQAEKNRFVGYKHQQGSIREKALQGRAAPEDHDDFLDVIDRAEIQAAGKKVISNVWDIERAKLTTAQLKDSPWSDTYWPLYMGAAAQRYLDSDFPKSTSWKTNFDYFLKFPTLEKTEQLSPAEKWDLLVGDTNKSLTRNQWEEGRGYYEAYKKVETWMGLCHGWATAAIQELRPKKIVTAKSASGDDLTFYPSDIKALATLGWSNMSFRSRFVGGRCNAKDPKTDTAGRVVDTECFDNNPMTFVLALVNQIGQAQRSFIMDATFDYEVWNQPIYGYEISYFNVETGESANRLTKANAETLLVKKENFSKDKFKKYRNTPYTQVLGVNVTVRYVVETSPTDADSDSSANDAITSARYMADLELDDAGNVLGGEWYTSKHPDFLWVSEPSQKFNSGLDRQTVGAWQAESQPFPAAWAKVAPSASSRGLPLAKGLEALIDAAQE
jgi:hypothetical protein